jgi:hypothetical protein
MTNSTFLCIGAPPFFSYYNGCRKKRKEEIARILKEYGIIRDDRTKVDIIPIIFHFPDVMSPEVFHTFHRFFHRQNRDKPPMYGGLQAGGRKNSTVLHKTVEKFWFTKH